MVHGNWLAKWAKFSPQKTALIERQNGRSTSYHELNRRADRAAHMLMDHFGVGFGDRVAVLAQNRIEHVELYFAAAKIGAVLVPVNWRLAPIEVAYILNNSEPKVLFHDASLAPTVDDIETRGYWSGRCFSLDQNDSLGYETHLDRAADSPVETEGINEDTPLMFLYTSGTTGRPKGAILTHGTITWNAINTSTCWDLHYDDVTLTHTPFFHTGGWNVLTLPLLHRGATVVLADRFDPGETLEAVDAYGITILFAVPTMFQMMLDHARMKLTSFEKARYFISGGAPCPIPLIETFQTKGVVFKQGYGLTEVGPNCFVLDAADALSKAGSVGFPMLHLDTRLVDTDGAEIGPDEVGELELRGPTVCAGYWRNEAATTAAVTEGGWFKTGDLFRRDSEGYHFVVGRLEEMYISGGENVYPAEIERVLYDLRGVVESAVIGVPHEKWGEVGHAFLAFTTDIEPCTSDEILDHCRKHLAKYKVPMAVTILDELPKSSSGKIHKQELSLLAAPNAESA